MSRLSPHGPRAAELLALASGHADLVLVEGQARCLDLIQHGLVPEQLIVAQGHLEGLAPALRSTAWETLEAPLPTYGRLVGSRTLPGVSAVFRRPLTTWQDLDDAQLLLGIDAVQDPGNLGALIRVAAALGADGVLVGPGCARPWSVKALRASAAATFLVPVLELKAWAEVQDHGLQVAMASAHDGQPPTAEPWLGRWVLVVGNEGHGSALSGRAVTWPLRSGVESLNVAVAAALLLSAILAGQRR